MMAGDCILGEGQIPKGCYGEYLGEIEGFGGLA